jgi:hypothetical protein
MLFSYGSGRQRIDSNNKCRQIAGNFDCHGNAAVRRRVHRPMKHNQFWLSWQCSGTTQGTSPDRAHPGGFAWSHWMPPSVECLRRIAPVAAMVDKFEWNTQNTNKTQLLASNYGTFQSLVVCDNVNPKTDPLLSSSMRQALFKCEMPRLELKSSATFLAINIVSGQNLKKKLS